MIAPVTLYVTEFLWFVMPAALELSAGIRIPQTAYSTGILAVMHCLQYLWITNYHARREATAEAASWRWQTYFGILILGGMVLFLPGRWFASYVLGRDFTLSGLIFTALINIHHFILDGAIWKLRDARIRRLLTSTEAAEIEKATPVWAMAAAVASLGSNCRCPASDAHRVGSGSVLPREPADEHVEHRDGGKHESLRFDDPNAAWTRVRSQRRSSSDGRFLSTGPANRSG